MKPQTLPSTLALAALCALCFPLVTDATMNSSDQSVRKLVSFFERISIDLPAPSTQSPCHREASHEMHSGSPALHVVSAPLIFVNEELNRDQWKPSNNDETLPEVENCCHDLDVPESKNLVDEPLSDDSLKPVVVYQEINDDLLEPVLSYSENMITPPESPLAQFSRAESEFPSTGSEVDALIPLTPESVEEPRSDYLLKPQEVSNDLLEPVLSNSSMDTPLESPLSHQEVNNDLLEPVLSNSTMDTQPESPSSQFSSPESQLTSVGSIVDTFTPLTPPISETDSDITQTFTLSSFRVFLAKISVKSASSISIVHPLKFFEKIEPMNMKSKVKIADGRHPKSVSATDKSFLKQATTNVLLSAENIAVVKALWKRILNTKPEEGIFRVNPKYDEIDQIMSGNAALDIATVNVAATILKRNMGNVMGKRQATKIAKKAQEYFDYELILSRIRTTNSLSEDDFSTKLQFIRSEAARELRNIFEKYSHNKEYLKMTFNNLRVLTTNKDVVKVTMMDSTSMVLSGISDQLFSNSETRKDDDIALTQPQKKLKLMTQFGEKHFTSGPQYATFIMLEYGL